jgi:uncharacterized protein YbjT (DUF2867 family)
VDSLTAALKDVDAVVSTVGGSAVESQIPLIDAAIAARVKRFIPSDFGNVTTNPKLEPIPLYTPMFKIRGYLEQKAAAGQLSWTVLASGAFLDLILSTTSLLDFQNHTTLLIDEGDNRISATSLAKIGKAIASILRNPDATKDRIVRISEAILTQNQLIGFASELQPKVTWSTSKERSDVLLQEGLKQLGAGDFGMPAIMKVMKGTALAGNTYGSAFDVTDNALLGIHELAPADIKKLLSEKLN